MQLFSEERVYDSLLESGLFEQFSNSFFVIAEDKSSWQWITRKNGIPLWICQIFE